MAECSPHLDRPTISLSNEVAGLRDIKETLREAAKEAQSSSDNDGKCTRVLLYGVPGAGKSFVARALISEAENMKFYHLHCFDLLSRFTDGIGRLSNLFRSARDNSPSIILLDDMECFSPTKAQGWCEKEREVMAEFRSQMQASNNGVLVISTASDPWAIDKSIIECFDTRLHIPMPDKEVRKEMIQIELNKTPHSLTDDDLDKIAGEIEGYSPADISVLIRDALMEPVRKIQKATHFKKVTGPSPEDPEVLVEDLLEVCSPDAPGAIAMTWMDVPVPDKLQTPPISMEDMCIVLRRCKPSVNKEKIEKYVMFENSCKEENKGE